MKDLFSGHAADYARFRPGYPPALIDHILQYVKERDCAWDCATGNGQAAVLLSDHFGRVEATDISEGQLAQATHRHNIRYQTAAEGTHFPERYFDLVTVAQAYHWLDQEAFAQEVRRVGKPGCVIAVWGYGLVQTGDPAINQWLQHFYRVVVGPYWDAERSQIDEEYRNSHFPFDPLPGAHFIEERNWDRDDLQGYLSTWSAVKHYEKALGRDPVAEELKQLSSLGPGEQCWFRFPIFLRLGQIS